MGRHVIENPEENSVWYCQGIAGLSKRMSRALEEAMERMRGIQIVAFNVEGYQRVIARFDGQQVRMTDGRINLNDSAILEVGGGGVGVVIDPAAFPEMVKFVITEWK
jgi:carbamate kinase